MNEWLDLNGFDPTVYIPLWVIEEYERSINESI